MSKEYNPVDMNEIKSTLNIYQLTFLEKELIQILHDIWENRRFLNAEDNEKLKYFKDKGL